MSTSPNPYDSPEAGQPRGGGAGKVLMILAFVFLGFLVVCCGIVGGLGYWSYNLASNATSQDPATIRQVTAEIVAIKIPEQFQPVVSVNMKIPFTENSMQTVTYRAADSDGNLTLTQFSGENSGDPQARAQFDAALRKNQQQLEQVVVEKSEKVERTINGQPATFLVGEGKKRGSDEPYWHVIGDFEGRAGTASLRLEAKQSGLTREQIDELLNSMQ